jgi:rare lipoprotein A
LNRIAHGRWLAVGQAGRTHGWVFVSVLALGVAGCHHKNPQVAYQPPPSPPTNAQAPIERPAHPGEARSPTASTKAPGSAPQPVPPHGKPLETEVGMASWYVPTYPGAKAADGSVYDQNAMTAANRELPMGSIVRVTNLTNNQTVVVRITDRGPFVDGRIIDLSLAAAKAVDIYRAGTAKVRLEAYAPEGYDPDGKWCVQIGAFMTEADAIQLKNDLMRRYATAKVIEFAGATGHWVRIKPMNPGKSSARQIAENIHVPDAQPYLVRLN